MKENVFEPFLLDFGDEKRASGGRDFLMKETLSNYQGLLDRCPELKELRDRLRVAIARRLDAQTNPL